MNRIKIKKEADIKENYSGIVEFPNGKKYLYSYGKKGKEHKDPQHYLVSLDVLVPATLTFKVLAKDEHEAAELIKKAQPTSIKYKLSGKRDLKIQIVEYATSVIKLLKRFA